MLERKIVTFDGKPSHWFHTMGNEYYITCPRCGKFNENSRGDFKEMEIGDSFSCCHCGKDIFIVASITSITVSPVQEYVETKP